LNTIFLCINDIPAPCKDISARIGRTGLKFQNGDEGKKEVHIRVGMCKTPSQVTTMFALIILSAAVDIKIYRYALLVAMLADMQDAHTAWY
jgi:hypothetical protein